MVLERVGCGQITGDPRENEKKHGITLNGKNFGVLFWWIFREPWVILSEIQLPDMYLKKNLYIVFGTSTYRSKSQQYTAPER